MGRSSGASSVDVGVLTFFVFTNLLEGSLDVSSANFPDAILRFALGNFDEGIFFLAGLRFSDGDFAMRCRFLDRWSLRFQACFRVPFDES